MFPFVNMEVQIQTYDSGQENGLSLCMKSTDEVVSVDFIRQRMVKEDSLDAVLVCDSFK